MNSRKYWRTAGANFCVSVELDDGTRYARSEFATPDKVWAALVAMRLRNEIPEEVLKAFKKPVDLQTRKPQP